VGELRAQVAEQQELIRNLMGRPGDGKGGDGNGGSGDGAGGMGMTASTSGASGGAQQDNERTSLLKKVPAAGASSRAPPTAFPIPAYGAMGATSSALSSNGVR
jgi:hypothetical protein